MTEPSDSRQFRASEAMSDSDSTTTSTNCRKRELEECEIFGLSSKRRKITSLQDRLQNLQSWRKTHAEALMKQAENTSNASNTQAEATLAREKMSRLADTLHPFIDYLGPLQEETNAIVREDNAFQEALRSTPITRSTTEAGRRLRRRTDRFMERLREPMQFVFEVKEEKNRLIAAIERYGAATHMKNMHEGYCCSVENDVKLAHEDHRLLLNQYFKASLTIGLRLGKE